MLMTDFSSILFYSEILYFLCIMCTKHTVHNKLLCYVSMVCMPLLLWMEMKESWYDLLFKKILKKKKQKQNRKKWVCCMRCIRLLHMYHEFSKSTIFSEYTHVGTFYVPLVLKIICKATITVLRSIHKAFILLI